MDESLRDILREIRDLMQSQRDASIRTLPCCPTLPNGSPVPVMPPYGYDPPARSPSDVGGDYCRKVQAAIEHVVGSWNDIIRANPHWKSAGISALVYTIATSTNILPAIKDRVVWDVVASMYDAVLNVVEDNLLIGSVNLCDAAREYTDGVDGNGIPDAVWNAIPVLARPGFTIWWQLSGGITPILDDPDYQYDPALYNGSCCIPEVGVVKWRPRYVGQNCSGFTDGFHGVDWYGHRIDDEDGIDISSLYPRVEYDDGLIAFRRNDYAGMYFAFPGYSGQLPDRIYLRDNPDVTVCGIFQGAYSEDVTTTTQTSYRIVGTGSQYIIVRAATIGDGRNWYIRKSPMPDHAIVDL